GELKQTLQDVNFILRDEGSPQIVGKSVLNKIFRRASEDILIGKYLFRTQSAEELEKYNSNWHMKIGYSVDAFLFRLYVQERILSLCKGKFDYESNVYRAGNWYNTLDLQNNTEHKSLYKQIAEILEEHNLRDHAPLLDL